MSGGFVAAGVAWSPEIGVAAVEVRVDDGAWQLVETSEPLSDRSWVQWQAPLDLAPGSHTIAVRAIDETGPQTAEVVPPRPDGATGHHEIRITVV
jgi:hypothetical protein